GGSKLDKIQRHRSDEPVPVPHFNPNVPPGFIGLLRKMVAKNPDKRIQSAAELREELLVWASGDTVLPLDRRDDREYREAVEALEHAEAEPDLLAEEIPVGVPEPPPAPRGRSNVFALTDLANSLATPEALPWPTFLAFVVLGGVVGLTVTVLAVFYL